MTEREWFLLFGLLGALGFLFAIWSKKTSILGNMRLAIKLGWVAIGFTSSALVVWCIWMASIYG